MSWGLVALPWLLLWWSWFVRVVKRDGGRVRFSFVPSTQALVKITASMRAFQDSMRRVAGAFEKFNAEWRDAQVRAIRAEIDFPEDFGA